MNRSKAILIATLVLLLAGVDAAAAQAWFDPTADVQGQIAAYEQQMDVWVQQQMQAAQQQSDQAYANIVRFYADYYRQSTGDYATPDNVAASYGEKLYCQDNPAKCQQMQQEANSWSQISAAGHAQNMADIESWGQTMNQIGQVNSGILDASQSGFMARQALQDQGQANYVQGAVYGEGTFTNAGNGASFTLPVYPDPSMSYTTPDGQPLSFDYDTGTWYQGDAAGWWNPLQQQP